MAGTRRHIGDLQGEIHDLFAELWQMPRFAAPRRGFLPQCDCYQTEDPPTLHVVVELPGVDPSSVQLVVSGRVLVIAGSRVPPEVRGARYQQMEIEYGAFQRRLELAEGVDAGGARATYDAGMLRIELPLARVALARHRVPIDVRER